VGRFRPSQEHVYKQDDVAEGYKAHQTQKGIKSMPSPELFQCPLLSFNKGNHSFTEMLHKQTDDVEAKARPCNHGLKYVQQNCQQ